MDFERSTPNVEKTATNTSLLRILCQLLSPARPSRSRRQQDASSNVRKSAKIATFDATVAGEFKKLPSIIVDEKNFNDKVLYLYL